MRTTMRATAWVVYKMTIHGKQGDINAVCEQGEWDAMELERPGYHVLVRDHIANEVEAEALARTGSGYIATPGRVNKSKPAPHKRPPACQPLPTVPATPG